MFRNCFIIINIKNKYVNRGEYMYFEYGDKEIEYLKNKDKKLGKVIDKLGYVKREVDKDLFSSVVHHIVGQQISSKAQATIWKKINDNVGNINPKNIEKTGVEELQSYGISFRKAEYIMEFTKQVLSNQFDLEEICNKSDEDAILQLTSIKGIGVWTAEMILLFCMERSNVFSFDDLAIQRGLRMVYHHRKVTKTLFEKYRRRFTPYCSVASLYLWEVASGKIDDMKDYAPKNSKKV